MMVRLSFTGDERCELGDDQRETGVSARRLNSGLREGRLPGWRVRVAFQYIPIHSNTFQYIPMHTNTWELFQLSETHSPDTGEEAELWVGWGSDYQGGAFPTWWEIDRGAVVGAQLKHMRRCEIKVQFESGAKKKFLAVVFQPMTTISDYQSVPWSHSFQNMYNTHMCKMQLTVEKWGFS